ncbi:hypothetical protein ABZW49_34725 [Nonomuraea wenchangensis]
MSVALLATKGSGGGRAVDDATLSLFEVEWVQLVERLQGCDPEGPYPALLGKRRTLKLQQSLEAWSQVIGVVLQVGSQC